LHWHWHLWVLILSFVDVFGCGVLFGLWLVFWLWRLIWLRDGVKGWVVICSSGDGDLQ